MSRYDDDYDENKDDLDDDEQDDDEGVRGSTSNPFSNRPNSVRGAGLPQQRPPQTPQGGSSGSVPSPIRSPGANPNLPNSNRPNNPSQGGSGSSNTNPNNSPRPNNPSQGGSGTSNTNPNNFPRPNNPSQSGSGSSNSNSFPRPNNSGSGSSGGVQPYGGGRTSPSPIRGDEKKDDENDRSAAVNRALGSFGQKLVDNKPEDRSSGGFGARPGSNDRGDDKSGLGGLTRNLSGAVPSRLGGDTKKDDKPAGGGLGGLASRFGGGDKKDDKKDNKPAGGGFGGLSSRLGGDTKKDDKPAGGGLGGLASRFGGGDKKDDKKDNKPAGGGLGGLTSRMGGSDRKDDKPSGGGGLGGLASRFGGDKKDDKPAATTYGGARPGDTSGRSQSPLGGTLSGGAKPQTSSSSMSGAGSTSRSPFGSSTTSTPGKPIGNKKPAPSLSERLKAINPFIPKKEDRPAARKAPSKAPRVDQSGLSLDHKLDILGVVLLLGSLVLVLSSLSPTKGALTEAVNHNLSYVFGWGAIFVLGVTFAIGVWLILRHFGDEAPVISRTRLIGLAMLFLGVLVAAQFIDSFQYKVGADQDYLTILKTVFLPIAYSLGRGGGWIGGEIYFQLLSNFGEIGGFMVVVGWLIVGVMLALSLSASDLAMIVVSNVRNLSDALAQRRQRAAAVSAAKQQALVTATQQISVSKPADTALPLPAMAVSAAAVTPALPATTADDQRRIPITTGGRTSNVPFRAAEAVDAPADGANVPAAGIPLTGIPLTGIPALVQPVPVAQEKSGGLFSRVKTVLPGTKSPDDAPKPADKPLAAADKAPAAGGLRGRFFGGKQDAEAVPPVAAPTAAQRLSPVPSAQPTSQPIPFQPAAQVAQPNASNPPLMSPVPRTASVSQPEVPITAAFGQPEVPIPAEQSSARLGDLLRRSPPPTGETPQPTAQTPPTVQPFQRTPLSRPEVPATGDRKLPEAAPSSSSAPVPMPDLQSRMQALRQSTEAPKPAELTGAPPTMQPPARPAASSAFGRPEDPPFAVPQRTSPPAAPVSNGANGHASNTSEVAPPLPPRRVARNWKVPDSAGLLTSGVDEEPDHEMLLKRAHIIEETLSSFGAPGRVVDVRTGPVVTQFGVEPDYVPGRGGKKNRVKVGAIAALDKDLQLALGAKAIRIEAPVPGKGYVGVEVPNEKAEVVHLRDVMESPEFKKIKSPLAIALGQGVDGTPVAGDLASMPHLLIAGTTGSGKSVCVNSIIACLLLQNSPKQLKFVMVDPKRVELTQYNGVPHLIAPVVVELERIISVLKWVTREMDERYRKFSNAAARNIEDYNKHLPATDEPMPYIVVIIDELADLMMLAPDDTERTITRIAALARATGIHLVIATQRPSVDVVTGLIKANFPARVAFAVASNTDSRVILDQPGAERLLGRGDMLYMGGDTPAPVRLQGVWVSDTEIANITRFWRAQMSQEDVIAASRPIGASIDTGSSSRGSGTSNFGSSRNSTPAPHSQEAFWDDDEDEDDGSDDDESADGEDEMYEEAVEMVRRLNKASVSLLQRRLRIGYTRAARLIDTMEERGIVGPATEGSKPRDVLPVR